jgi:hypothetical protein
MRVERCDPLGRLSVIGEENGAGIGIAPRYDKMHALSPLWRKAERVHDTTGPTVTALSEGVDERRHRAPSVQTQHEGHVLQHHERRGVGVGKPEDRAD